MAAALEDRSSSSQAAAEQLAAAQAAAAAAAQPALQQLQAVLAEVSQRGEPQAAALATAMQAAAEALRQLAPADRDLPGCLGGLGAAVGQLVAGYPHVAAMLQERQQARSGTRWKTVVGGTRPLVTWSVCAPSTRSPAPRVSRRRRCTTSSPRSPPACSTPPPATAAACSSPRRAAARWRPAAAALAAVATAPWCRCCSG